jgi:hypothetical protein
LNGKPYKDIKSALDGDGYSIDLMKLAVLIGITPDGTIGNNVNGVCYQDPFEPDGK